MNTAVDGMPCSPTLDAAEAPSGPRRRTRRRPPLTAVLRRALLASSLACATQAAVSRAEDAPTPAAAPPEAAPPAPDAAPAAPTPAARELIPPGTAVRLLGRDVKGPSGETVAQIVNVLVDRAGQPVAAVLDYGGFMGVGRRRIAVAWRALRFMPDETPDGTVTLALTRDQLKDFPEAKRGEPVVAAAPAAADAAPK